MCYHVTVIDRPSKRERMYMRACVCVKGFLPITGC